MKFSTDPSEPELSVIEKNSARLLMSFLTDSKADAIGISCGGPLDSKRGIIMRPPNLPMWDDIHITEILEKRYNIPAFFAKMMPMPVLSPNGFSVQEKAAKI